MTGRDAQPLLDETLDDADLQRAVALLATLAEGPAPAPSAALDDLLSRGFHPTVVPFVRPAAARRRWAARTGAGLAAAAASVVLAGTAAALPAPLQDTVADLVSALTPFELPRPPSDDDRGTADSEEPALVESPAATIAPTPSAPASTAPAARTTTDPGRTDEGPDDSASPERQAREQQRAEEDTAEEDAAEESQEAAEDAADDAADRADDAADEAADAAADANEDAERAEDDAADAD